MKEFSGSFVWDGWLIDMRGVIHMDNTDMAVVEGAYYLKAMAFEMVEPFNFQIPVKELEGLEGKELLKKLFIFYFYNGNEK